MVTRPHHVRQRQQRRHQCVIRPDGQRDQGSVRLRDAHGFALPTVQLRTTPPPAVETGRLESLLAELTGTVRPEEWRDHEIASLHRSHPRADVFDDSSEFVTHAVADRCSRHGVVRPKVAATDTGPRHSHERIGRFDDTRVPHDLPNHRCINLRGGSAGPYRWEFEKDGVSLAVDVSGPLVVDDADLMIRAAIDGLGLTFSFEEYVAPQLASGALVRVLEDWCPPFAGYFLYYPSRRQQPAAMSALIGILRL
jgi:DNA-binding transcriptional LysR family regulator